MAAKQWDKQLPTARLLRLKKFFCDAVPGQQHHGINGVDVGGFICSQQQTRPRRTAVLAAFVFQATADTSTVVTC